MAVQASDVKLVLPGTDLTNSEVDTFINRAKRLYEARIESSVNQDEKDDVVTHLAAHLIATGPERQLSSGGEGGGQVSFTGDTGEGLMATTHGQQAIALDPTGELDGSSSEFTLTR